jgi:peptidoglycan/xylan/chitin deacetylase (PgdA/CDA1 family)
VSVSVALACLLFLSWVADAGWVPRAASATPARSGLRAINAVVAPWTIPPAQPIAGQDVINALRDEIPGAQPPPHRARTVQRSQPITQRTSHTRSGSISVISRGSRSHRWIALTFDDGWDAARCRSIEHTLLEKHVTATWFPNAVYVRNAPTLWRSIASHFPIGNHTRSHPDLTTLSTKAVRNQIRSDEKIVESITGHQMIKVFRPPYGAYNHTVLRVAAGLGYRDLVLWNVDDRDTQGASASQALAYAERGGRGSIVLMHCGPQITPGILPAVIDYYRSRGYRFVTIPTLLGW